MTQDFIYKLPEGWKNETVIGQNGDPVPRYGRLLIREGSGKGTVRPDGALFDRKNPLRSIMPVNQKISTQVMVSKTGKVTTRRIRSLFAPGAHLPGGGVYGDVGNL